MFKVAVFTTVTLACSLFTQMSYAQEACQFRNLKNALILNGGDGERQINMSKSSCQSSFKNNKTTLFEYTSISNVRKPSNGTLTIKGANGFIYSANQGFKGNDSFTIKVCAKDPKKEGCANMVYKVVVN